MYPIESSLAEIKKALADNKDVILTAEPGAGKSTVVPLELKEESWLKGKKILMLQPRRVAAVAIAERMANSDNSKPGDTIGHCVRFSSNVKSSTKIEVLTEGILTRRLQKDPFLENVGLVIFDEFHERNIHGDLCLALCREVKREIRPDLRLMVMSATIDTKLVSSFLDSSEIINGKGFLYSVAIEYNPIGVGKEYFDNAAKAIYNIVLNNKREEEYLVFLPGLGEINKVKDFLAVHSSALNHETIPLHGSMSIKEQQHALSKGEKPRIILSTNLAETSLTIDGITTVIDSGYMRQTDFNTQTGLNALSLKRISKASAKQRAGRAGRLKAGKAIRLYSKGEFELLSEDETPEILRSDPTSILLELFAWGVKEPFNFNWLESPSKESVLNSVDLLKKLGAIDEKNNITDFGKKISEIPIEPRLASMLVKAEKCGLIEEAALAAGIIVEKDFVETSNPDLALRLEILTQQSNGNKYNLDRSIIWRIKKEANSIKSQIENRFEKDPAEKLTRKDKNWLNHLLLEAFPDRVCQRRGGDKNNSYTLCTGQGLKIDSESLLTESEYILALRQDSKLRASGDGKIFLASKLDIQWLINSPISQKSREIFFSEKSEKVCVRERIRYQNLILKEQETKLKEDEKEKALEVFCQAIENNFEKALGLEEKFNKEFMGRLRLIQTTSYGKNYPCLDKEWLKEGLISMATIENLSFSWLQKQNISEIYLNQLNWKLREGFNKLVPERLQVPTGSNIKISYTLGNQPVLAVKMQEMFGCTTTPTICNGEVNLVIHLLSPAGRLMQATSDLASFWQNGYKTTVGELKGRYPKHFWPENPASARATRKTKRANNSEPKNF